jgi:glycosyltransferase involved in cell wall biosynthesis
MGACFALVAGAAVSFVRSSSLPVRVALVAPSLGILGGQAVQAHRLLHAWHGDPEIDARLVPVNPVAPWPLAALQRVKYLRTATTQACYWPRLLAALRQADVVHVFSASYLSFVLAPWPAVKVARLLGKPVLFNYRSGEAPDHLARSALARRTLASADLNVVPSRFLHDVFANHGIAATVIPNVVDVDRFAFHPRTPLRPRLLSTRNFEPLYNVACTLRAFRLVQDRYSSATLVLVGGGSEETALRELAGRLRLEGVSFVGRVAPDDIWRHYAAADVYVQSPNIDNMPSSILEAWASGTPVVATRAGGVPAILSDGENGLLAPLDDHVAVARNVLRLLGDPASATRLAESGRQSAESYTWPKVRTCWLEAYRALLARPALAAEPLSSQ